jgi:hypothetical protein
VKYFIANFAWKQIDGPLAKQFPSGQTMVIQEAESEAAAKAGVRTRFPGKKITKLTLREFTPSAKP